MKKFFIGLTALIVLCVLAGPASAMSKPPKNPGPGPYPFIFDGCSVVPEGIPWDPDKEYLWCDCCIEHDIVYWRGGTWKDRHIADAELGKCVAKKTGIDALGLAFFLGTQVGGNPYTGQPYRWGYAWGDGRTYQVNTDAENQALDVLLEDWEDRMDGKDCSDKIEEFKK